MLVVVVRTLRKLPSLRALEIERNRLVGVQVRDSSSCVQPSEASESTPETTGPRTSQVSFGSKISFLQLRLLHGSHYKLSVHRAIRAWDNIGMALVHHHTHTKLLESPIVANTFWWCFRQCSHFGQPFWPYLLLPPWTGCLSILLKTSAADVWDAHLLVNCSTFICRGLEDSSSIKGGMTDSSAADWELSRYIGAIDSISGVALSLKSWFHKLSSIASPPKFKSGASCKVLSNSTPAGGVERA